MVLVPMRRLWGRLSFPQLNWIFLCVEFAFKSPSTKAKAEGDIWREVRERFPAKTHCVCTVEDPATWPPLLLFVIRHRQCIKNRMNHDSRLAARRRRCCS